MAVKRITESHAAWVSRTLSHAGGGRPDSVRVGSGFGAVLVTCVPKHVGATARLLTRLGYDFSRRDDVDPTRTGFLVYSRRSAGPSRRVSDRRSTQR